MVWFISVLNIFYYFSFIKNIFVYQYLKKMSFMLPQQSVYNDKQQSSYLMTTEDQASICDLRMESSITKKQFSENSKNSNIEELITQISTVQSSYEVMKDQYISKISQLKQQLSRKSTQQSQLTQELRSLYAEFEQEKKQISMLTRLIESQMKQSRREDKKLRMSPKAVTNRRDTSPKISGTSDLNKKKLLMSPQKKQQKLRATENRNQDFKQTSRTINQNEQNKMTISAKFKSKQTKMGAISQKKIDIEQFVYLK